MRHLAKKQAVDMLSGSIAKGLISVSLPIMITNVGQSLFNIADMTVLQVPAECSSAGLMVGIPADAPCRAYLTET